jgi:hypothetical protein
MVGEGDVGLMGRVISLPDHDVWIPQVAWNRFKVNIVLRGIHGSAEPCKGSRKEKCSHGGQRVKQLSLRLGLYVHRGLADSLSHIPSSVMNMYDILRACLPACLPASLTAAWTRGLTLHRTDPWMTPEIMLECSTADVMVALELGLSSGAVTAVAGDVNCMLSHGACGAVPRVQG